MLREFHVATAYVVVGLNGLTGLAGLALAALRRPPGRLFDVAKYVALASAFVQVSLGLVLYGRGNNPGSIHMFYGIVIMFTLAFAYIYRAQLARRPALAWGLVLLFTMGLGLRGWMNFGESFG